MVGWSAGRRPRSVTSGIMGDPPPSLQMLAGMTSRFRTLSMFNHTLRCVVFLLLSCFVTALPLRAAGVVVDEIMYHPASTNRLEEWFELHNAGADPVDLSGWRVTRGVDFTFPLDFTVPPGGRAVLVGFPTSDAWLRSPTPPRLTSSASTVSLHLQFHEGQAARLSSARLIRATQWGAAFPTDVRERLAVGPNSNKA